MTGGLRGRRIGGAAVLAVAFAFAGCSGGSSSGPTGTSAAPSASASASGPAASVASPGTGGLGTRPPSAFGSAIGDVSCDLGGHDDAYHIHATFSVVVDGAPNVADPDIGLGTTPEGQPCMYWVHTHEEPGRLVHIEAPQNVAVTLGDFIEVWRATYPGSPVLAATLDALAGGRYTLDGAAGPADWSGVPLRDTLAIVVGG